MRSRMLVAAGLAAGRGDVDGVAEDGYRHGPGFFIEPGVTLQRATEWAEERSPTALLPADRVWTVAGGRVPVPRRTRVCGSIT